MQNTHASRRVSRETRQLLAAALVAIVALWVLARIRYPNQPATPNPIPSLLSQLSTAPRFANLAAEIAELQGRLAGSWLSLPVSIEVDQSSPAVTRHLPALRLRENAAVVLLHDGSRPVDETTTIGFDGLTGLAVVRIPVDPGPSGVTPWVPPSLGDPRYLMATVASPDGVALRPVLVASLREGRSPAWPGPIWAAPEGTELDPGTFAFTATGEIAGLVIDEPGGPAIVPWDFVVAEATQLLARPRPLTANLGVEVQPLTRLLERATGASSGVVVTWVDPNGPAAGQLAVGDVIEAVKGAAILTWRDWEVVRHRLSAGTVRVQVRRRGTVVEIQFVLQVPAAPTGSPSLGLTLRSAPGTGVVVLRVDPQSAASGAGLREGDVITVAGDTQAPTAAQLEDQFQSAEAGRVLLLAVTRGSAHLVIGLER